MDLGALIFVPTLAACAVIGFPLALFSAASYLNVLQSTGSGAKYVSWVSESVPDHFWKVFYLAWLIGLWFGPGFLLSRGMEAGRDSTLMAYAIPLAVIWLCYPISQLSSLGGPTLWLPLWPDVFARLLQRPLTVLGFYAFSAIVLAGIGLAFHWSFGNSSPMLLLIGVPMLVVFWFLYARLLGRLAFVLMFTRPLFQRKKVKPRKPKLLAQMGDEPLPEPPKSRREREDRRRVQQPSEQPPLQTPDEGPLHGYDVRFADDLPPPTPPPPPPRPRREKPKPVPAEPSDDPVEAAARHRRKHLDASRRWDEDDDDDTPYTAHAPEVAPEERAPKELMKPSASEMRLINRADEPKKPKQAWTAELFAFLPQPETVKAMVLLVFLGLMVAGLVQLAKAFNPVGGAAG